MVFIGISIQTQGDQVYNSTTKHGKMWYYPLTSIRCIPIFVIDQLPQNQQNWCGEIIV